MKRSEFICYVLNIKDNDKALNILENEFGASYGEDEIAEVFDAYYLNQGKYDSRNYLLYILFDRLVETDFVYRVAEAEGTSEDTAFQDYSEDFDVFVNGEFATFVYRGYKFETNEELDLLIDDFANGKI